MARLVWGLGRCVHCSAVLGVSKFVRSSFVFIHHDTGRRTWHQMLRRVSDLLSGVSHCPQYPICLCQFLAPLGKAASTAFGFKHGTLGSSYTQLYVAFFLSGIVHTGGDIALSPHSSAASQSLFSMPFFLSQALIITLEDMVIWIAGRLGVKTNTWTRILGYVWVVAWFGWCVPEMVKHAIWAGVGIRGAGADENAGMGFNLVQAMLGIFGFDIGAFAESWFSKA